MEAFDIFKCISDRQRLRILNLLSSGPLCVCHLQELLEVAQVKMSKQLSGMRQIGLVDCRREGTWMIYHLKEPIPPLLSTNLEHILTASGEECNELQSDLQARHKLITSIINQDIECPSLVCEDSNCC